MTGTRLSRIVLPSMCVLALAGCVSREQADEKLAKGCAAGINALLPEGYSFSKILEQEFKPGTEEQGQRYVRLKVIEMDGWLETEKNYECVFDESFGFMSSNFTASIYQIRFDDQVVGKSGKEILGDTQQFLKLTDAIRDAMY